MTFDFGKEISTRTDEQLVAIVASPQKWLPEFVELARTEIARRNVDQDNIDRLMLEQAMATATRMGQEREGRRLYMILGFLLAPLVVPGLMGGYIYAFFQSEGPDGSLYYAYTESTRTVGQYMLLVNGVAGLYWLLQQLN